MNITKLLRLPEAIPCDKRMHYLVGSIFTTILLCIPLSMFAVVIALIVLAWGIEVSQRVFKWGTYHNYDAIAVVIGGLVVMLPYIIKGL